MALVLYITVIDDGGLVAVDLFNDVLNLPVPSGFIQDLCNAQLGVACANAVLIVNGAFHKSFVFAGVLEEFPIVNISNIPVEHLKEIQILAYLYFALCIVHLCVDGTALGLVIVVVGVFNGDAGFFNGS